MANRAQLIRENSDVNQWRYIKTKKNRANYTSHGLTPTYLKKVCFCGKQEESKQSNVEDEVHDISNEDWELKTTVSINAIKIESDILSNMVEQISNL